MARIKDTNRTTNRGPIRTRDRGKTNTLRGKARMPKDKWSARIVGRTMMFPNVVQSREPVSDVVLWTTSSRIVQGLLDKAIDRINNNKDNSVQGHLRMHWLFRTSLGHYSSELLSNSIDHHSSSRPVSNGRIRISVLNRIEMDNKAGSNKLQTGHSSEDKYMPLIRLMQRLQTT